MSGLKSIINVIETYPEPASLGFKRLFALPKRLRLSLSQCEFDKGTHPTLIGARTKLFLENLTESQFIVWLKENGIKGSIPTTI
jgi:hypothetical protein